jgi:hypothetical protein
MRQLVPALFLICGYQKTMFFPGVFLAGGLSRFA